MRTNIVIDDSQMKAALKATGLRTKKQAVELGLQTLVRLNRQAGVGGQPVISATYCIDHDLPLLFEDKEFLPFVRHRGLREG